MLVCSCYSLCNITFTVQSLAFSMEMTRFLGDLMCDPQSSQLGALLRQREKLIEFGSSESPEIKANTSHLSKFEVGLMWCFG